MKIFYTVISFLIVGCTQKKFDNPHILLNTNFGDIEAELFVKKAPLTVAAFLNNVKNGTYKNSSFYRVLKNEDLPKDNNEGLIQAGLWPNKMVLKNIPDEPTSVTGLTHTDGTLSFARQAVGTANTEFFICIGNQTNLDAGRNNTIDSIGFSAFGTVLRGMQIVRKIQAQPCRNDLLVTRILISNITLL